MLKAMRKNVKSLAPTLWIVIATFIIAIFAVWGGAGRLGESGRVSTLASVGGERISADLYMNSLRQRLESIRKEFQSLNKNLIQQLNIPQQVLEQIVQQALLIQIAGDMGLRATDEEVGERIKSYPVFQRDGKFIGFDEYKKILEWNRLSLADFEEGLKKEILINKVVQLISAGVTVSDDELWENYVKQNETARIEYLVAETSKIETAERPGDAQVQSYFENNKEKYRIPDKRTADFVFFKTDDLKKEVKLQDPEIEKYYKDNIAQFQEPERAKVSRIFLPYTEKDNSLVAAEAQDVLKKIRAGEDFGEWAKKVSKDAKAENGGDWGFDDWRSLASNELDEIRRLEAGQVSDVLETVTGFAILKVTEKQPPVTKSLAEVTGTIKSVLEDQKARDLASRKAETLRKTALKEKSLDIAAQKENLKVRSTGALKKGDPLEEFDPSGTVSQEMFNLKEKEISRLIFAYGGVGVVQLQKIEAERPATLEEVRSDIEKDILETQKKELAHKKLLEIKPALKDNWTEAAEKNKLEFKTVEAHKRDQYLGLIGENAEVDRLAFSLPLKESSDPIAVENGYAIMRVLDRKTVTKEDFEKNKEAERNTMLEDKKGRFLQSYLSQVRGEKGVRVNSELFLRLNSDVLSRFQGEE